MVERGELETGGKSLVRECEGDKRYARAIGSYNKC